MCARPKPRPMMPTVSVRCAIFARLLSELRFGDRDRPRRSSGARAARSRDSRTTDDLRYHAAAEHRPGVSSEDPEARTASAAGNPHPEEQSMKEIKTRIANAVDALATELESLSHRIHAHPELGFEEVQAAGWLADFLGARGFHVERGVAGVPTAFRAAMDCGPGPRIAILCEYDALPGIGHACGHNVIAAAGAGAGAALAAVK